MLILLNIAVRIPVTPHEIGDDTFFIHWMAQSILEEKPAMWLVHPASVFGLYPYSYHSFVPFLLSIEKKDKIDYQKDGKGKNN